MESITGVFGAIAPSKFKFNNDDDSADKLSHRYTTVMLIVWAVIVSSKQFVGEPIQCWVPAHFSGSWESYANSYCWVKNTYYLPFEDHIPAAHEEEKRHMIPYYQWVPLILLGQALLFYIPRLIWRSLNTRTSIDVDDIVRMAEGFQKAELADKKESTMDMMALQMHRFLASRNFYGGTCTLSLTAILTRMCCIGRRTGNYLSACFLMSKFLYIVNLVGQLFLMNAFLGQDFHFYGIDVIRDLANGTDWRDSPRFPRVTMCDFIIRMLGNNVRYTVQCVLSINLFNEMIFLLIWFWLVVVAAVSVLNFIRWILCTVSTQDRKRYIRKQLKLLEAITEDNEKYVDQFITEYLKADGVFICRIIGVNTDAVTVTEFVCEMFKYYTGEKKMPGVEAAPAVAEAKAL